MRKVTGKGAVGTLTQRKEGAKGTTRLLLRGSAEFQICIIKGY